MGISRAAAPDEAASPPRPGSTEHRTSDFDYELPEELIALRPAASRDQSRLLVVDRDRRALEDRFFSDFGAFIPAGDVLVLNDTEVFPARLVGYKPTGARAEILLLRPREGQDSPRVWEAIVRPGGKLKPGRKVQIAEDLEVTILDSLPGGGRLVRLVGPGDPWTLIERHGHVPLPPYIDRPDDDDDRERYQTVYARHRGSVAAPTAGLHFTSESLAELEERGVRIVRLTLHVGVGTFRPVAAAHPAEHSLHAESFCLSESATRVLNEVRTGGGRVWAVGTTVCRALESAVDERRVFSPIEGETDLFIYPPFQFRAVDRLLTNFHLPRSSLLMLVAALAGHGLTLDAYEHAVRERYRFYSYGDAMLVL
jgi:S-adenosylmethionine:tRNA ribosyltransferase-isomerase